MFLQDIIQLKERKLFISEIELLISFKLYVVVCQKQSFLEYGKK